MKFFTIIGRNSLYTYEYNDQNYNVQFIEGGESFLISKANVFEDVNAYMEILANEKNLGTTAKLKFEILESDDTNFNRTIVAAFNEHIEKIYDLDSALKSVIKKLLSDKKLLVDIYGINYEGHSYKLENNDLLQGEFDLLGYTIHSNDVVGLMHL